MMERLEVSSVKMRSISVAVVQEKLGQRSSQKIPEKNAHC